MDAAYFWQKAATCLRLAQTLSSANPGRWSLLEMAEGFERRAKELEANLRSAKARQPERPDRGSHKQAVSRKQAC
jgi:hypothetical protein